jgi:hypothetical protein
MNRPRVAGRVRVQASVASRQLIGGSPATMPLYRALSRSEEELFVGPETDVCIDGYPRSGNTRARLAFDYWNPDGHVASHIHVAGQLREAIGRGIPAVLVIREPSESLASNIVWSDGLLSVGTALWSYTWFHRRLAGYLDGLSVWTFEDVLKDPARLVRGLNARFGSDFGSGEVDAEFEAHMAAENREIPSRRGTNPVTQGAGPSEQRSAMTKRVAAEIRAHRRYPDAEALYKRFVARADSGG